MKPLTLITILVLTIGGEPPEEASRPFADHGGARQTLVSHGHHHRRGFDPGRGMTDREQATIQALVRGHTSITRTVEEIPDGVLTRTTTSIPELVEPLRAHVRQMTNRLKERRPVRRWDPAFLGVFAHADEIKVTLTEIDGGIEVSETGTSPEAIEKIRAHAAKVSDFVARGHEAVRPPWAGRRQGRVRVAP